MAHHLNRILRTFSATIVLIASVASAQVAARDCNDKRCGVACPMHQLKVEERSCCNKEKIAPANLGACKCPKLATSRFAATKAPSANDVSWPADIPREAPTVFQSNFISESKAVFEIRNNGPPGSGQGNPSSPRAPPRAS